MLQIWHGPDTFSRAEALATLRSELDTDGMLATNTSTFASRGLKPDELIAACDAVPFLAAHRLAIVEGLLAAQTARPRRGRVTAGARGKQDTDSESPWQRLVDYAPRLPPTTTLLLIEADLTDANWLFTALRPLAQVRYFPILQREELQRWIQRRALATRVTIAPRAIAALAEAVGPDLWQMANDLEKLALYAGDRPVEESDVRALITVAQTGTVFQLVDAVVAGRGDEATRLVRQLIDDGAAGPYLLTMLARQYRQLLIARDLRSRGEQRAAIGRALEIRSDAVLGRLVAQAQSFPQQRLERIYARLLEVDLEIKRGIQTEDAALQLLVAELAADH